MADCKENFGGKLQELNKGVLEKMIKNRGVTKKAVTTNLNSKKASALSVHCEPSQWAAYLFRCSPCYTSAVAHHMLQMFNENLDFFRDVIGKGSIQVCCLGGNLALEAVALSQVVSCIQDQLSDGEKPLHLKITAMDKNRHWKNAALDVIQALTEAKDMFDASKMALSFDFVGTNFTQPLEDDAVKSLREADIVTMVNFIPPQTPWADTRQLVQDISAEMKDGAVLFYLNTSSNKQWSSVSRALKPFKCVFGPVQLEAFTLNLNFIRKSVKLFWQDYSNICLTSCIVNSCAWIKTTDPKRYKNLALQKTCAPMTKQEWDQKNKQNEKILKEYHSKVQALVPKRTSKKKDVCEGSRLVGLPQRMRKENALFSTKGKGRRIDL